MSLILAWSGLPAWSPPAEGMLAPAWRGKGIHSQPIRAPVTRPCTLGLRHLFPSQPGVLCSPILKMREGRPERPANLLGVFWNLNACIHQLNTCLFNFWFVPDTGMYRRLRQMGSLGSLCLTKEGRQTEWVKGWVVDCGGPPGDERPGTWGGWRVRGDSGEAVSGLERGLQVQMWPRSWPPRSGRAWIFLCMLGGPGRVSSEGVILSSLVSGKHHQGCGPQPQCHCFWVCYPWRRRRIRGRGATAGQGPALPPSTTQTPVWGTAAAW